MSDPASNIPSSTDTSASNQISFLDRLINLVQIIPWWAVALVGLLLYIGISSLNDPERRDVLDYLADRPKISTTELFEVTLRIEKPVLVVDESFLVVDLNESRSIIPASLVESRAEGTIFCPPDAPTGCLSQRGMVITYRDYRIPAGRTPDGVDVATGIVDLRGFGTVDVFLATGEEIRINGSQVLSEGNEGTLACDRLLNPACTALTGELIEFERPYILNQAIEVRGDVKVRYLDENYERTLRPTAILNRSEGVLACPDDAPQPCEEMPVTYAEVVDNITGVEVERNDKVVRVRTVDRVAMEVPRSRVLSMEPGLVSCDRDADPRCEDYEGTLFQLSGEDVEGRLTFESNTYYRIIPTGETVAIRYNRREIIEETRTPEDCLYAADTPCNIQIKLDTVSVGGRVQETDAGFVIETTPEKIVDVPLDEIVSTPRRVPGECALNNIRGCNQGLWLTLIVTVLSYSMALGIGLVIGILRVPSDPASPLLQKTIRGFLYHLATLYVEFVRGVPLLVLLFAFAFVIGPELRDIEGPVGDVFSAVFRTLDTFEKQVLGVDNLVSEAILGLAVGYGAYLAEVFRAGIQSISKGQMEAARSLGMSYAQAMRQVILPQAIRVVLPPLGNDFIAMLKDSSLIAVLALSDLFLMGRLYASSSFRYVPVFFALTLYYILMTLFLSLMVRFIERWAKLP